MRSRHRFTLPSRFLMVAGMNPCPCGYRGSGARPCRCTPLEVHRYMSRISGPLWDRFDLVVELPAVSLEELSVGPEGESSATVRARVERARGFQLERADCAGQRAGAAVPGGPAGGAPAVPAEEEGGGETGARGGIAPARWVSNARLSVRELPALASLPPDARRFLESASRRLSLSARAVHRVLRVARTIADLEGEATPALAHVAEALSYRPRFEAM